MKCMSIALIASAAVSADPTSLGEYPGSPTEHGSVTIQMVISPSGAVDGCKVVRPSGVGSLDNAACPIVAQRARWKPLDDQRGAAESLQLTLHFIVPHATQTKADLPIGTHDMLVIYNPATQRVGANGQRSIRGIGKAPQRLPMSGRISYPDAATKRGEGGQVGILVDVDENGKPSGCSVVRTSGHMDLDQETCAMAMKYFRYRPALDFSGQPMPGEDFYVTTWEQEEVGS